MRILLAVVASMVLAVPAEAATIPPGDLECNEAITQDTTLTRSLFDCPGHGLDIDADNITLDLGGFTVDGTDAGGSIGINLDGHLGITVRNGTITDFGDGISGGVDRIRVSKVSIRSVTNNAILIPNNSRVRSSTISGAGQGIGVASDNSVVAGNTVVAAVNGIVAGGGSDDNVIENNRVLGSTFNPIVALGQGNVIRKNRTEGNADTGIEIGGSDGKVIGNVTVGNHAVGMVIGGSAMLVRGNRSIGNDGDGIVVDGAATQVVLRDNVANSNELDGIDVDSVVVKLFDNQANRNGFTDGGVNLVGSGIIANDVAGVKGNGNRAKGNDGPNCLPARLC